MPAKIHQFSCRQDNFGVLIHDPQSGATAASDAPDAEAVEKALAETGWKLTDILVTHRHLDHVAGITPLVEKYKCRVTAPARARAEMPGADVFVEEGAAVSVGSLKAEVWDTPGHCRDHIAYYFAADKTLMAGDTLFALGCGRVSESTYAEMHASLMRMAMLPGDTAVYCGHEYTLANAKFALAAEPDNAALKIYAAEVEAKRARGEVCLPTTIARELAANPFLRATDLAEFQRLREWKNKF